MSIMLQPQTINSCWYKKKDDYMYLCLKVKAVYKYTLGTY